MPQSLSDKDIISDVLVMEKAMASSYNIRTMEAANEPIHQSMFNLLDESHKAQYAVFNLMARKGMYQILMSMPQDIAQVSNLVSQTLQNQTNQPNQQSQRNQQGQFQAQYGQQSFGVQQQQGTGGPTNLRFS